MLTLLDLGRPDVFAYRVTDVVTDNDVQTATEALDAVLADHSTVHLYAEVEGLKGFDARALWMDLVYGLQRLGALLQIGHVALVTDTEWVREVGRLEANLLPVGRFRVFESEAREQARAWIDEAPGKPEEAAAVFLASKDLDDWLDEDAVDFGGDGASERRRRPRAPRFGHTVHRTHMLLRDIASRLDTPGTAPAYHALRSVLPALRDRLPASEAAQLAAQLTTLVRGLFYEGYQPARAHEKVDRDAFLASVAEGLRRDASFDAEDAVRAVGGALSALVSAGEWDDVLGALPADVRALFDAPVEA